MSRPVDLSRHPDALSTLAAREAAIDAETPPIDASTISALSSLSAQLEAATRRLSALEAENSTLKTQNRASRTLLSKADKDARCVPTIIGPHDIPPSSEFDIRIAPSPFSTDEQVAWIPVVIWPTIQSERRGDRTFLNIGKTTVRESYAVATIYDSNNKPRYFALTAYASLSVNAELTPAEVEERCLAASAIDLLSNSDDPLETISPPFIPSEQTTRPAPFSKDNDIL